jgi:prephenate dehydratase
MQHRIEGADRIPVPRVSVAYQGEPGAFGEIAAELAVPGAEPLPASTFADVVMRVLRGDVPFGVLPVHNVIAGPVTSAQRAIEACPGVVQVGEVTVPVRLCVMGAPGAELAGITELLSQDVALAQCAEFLRRHPHIRPRVAPDTAAAARLVASEGTRTRAALAGPAAAVRYRLRVLAEGVEDREGNATRFAVIAARGAA